MGLAPGTRLGPYEIVSVIGAGGMGEVYKGRDTRLGRTVAIKVIHPRGAANREFRERFAREAKTISALDHPNICALYDVGEHGGIEFLVMQYLEGSTLAERLRGIGRLSLTEVLRHSTEIAAALERAHGAGIVHRDLKPANVMLTKTGAKLLDFGVAKMAAEVDSPDLPTATMIQGEPLTAPGQAPGTLCYMAPEQLSQGIVDARSDLFALGAIIFEMVTGRRAFAGSTRGEIADAVLRHDPPPISAARPEAPPLLDQVVTKCLRKEPAERWQTAKDLRDALAWIADHPSGAPPAAPPARPLAIIRRHRLAAAVVAVCLLGATGYAVLDFLPRRSALPAGAARRSPDAATGAPVAAEHAPAPIHLSISLPKHLAIPPNGPELALSPDGRRAVFRAARQDAPDVRRLYVRNLDSSELMVLTGTENARHPFWSPDGNSVGFFSHGRLRRHDLIGGATVDLCEAPSPRGASWSRDGGIVFSSSSGRNGLHKVQAEGGLPRQVTTIDAASGEQAHTWPVAIDGDRLLYAVEGINPAHAGTYLHSLQTGARTRVLSATSSVAYAAGHLVFHSAGTLMAAAFDPGGKAIAGEPFVLAERVFADARRTEFSVSDEVLAYWTREEARGQVTWTDRRGKVLHTLPSPTGIRDPSLSPDGKTIAFSGAGGTASSSDIWLLDWAKGTRRRISFGKASEHYPVWSPDGKQLVFTSNQSGRMQLYLKDVGSGDEQILLESDRDAFATQWAPDGRHIVFEYRDTRGGATRDLFVLPLRAAPRPLVATDADEREGKLSPNGRWLAYTSSESGRWQVFVRQFDDLAKVWQVSEDGGVQPEWSADGRELIFLANDRRLMSARINPATAFDFSPPRPLFVAPAAHVRPRSLYAISADGERFVFSAPPGIEREFITVVTHWHRR